jgi:hypothetical protein
LGLLNSAAIEKLKSQADSGISSAWNPYPPPASVISSFQRAFSTFCGTGGGNPAQAALNLWTSDMNGNLIGAICPFST